MVGFIFKVAVHKMHHIYPTRNIWCILWNSCLDSLCVGAEPVEVIGVKSFKVIYMKFHPVESEEVGGGLEGISHSRIRI